MSRWPFQSSLKDYVSFWKRNQMYLTPYFSHTCFHIKRIFHVTCQKNAIALSQTISENGAELIKAIPSDTFTVPAVLRTRFHMNINLLTATVFIIAFQALLHWGEIFWNILPKKQQGAMFSVPLGGNFGKCIFLCVLFSRLKTLWWYSFIALGDHLLIYPHKYCFITYYVPGIVL